MNPKEITTLSKEKYIVTGYQVYAIESGIGTLIEEIYDRKTNAERKLEFLRTHYPDLELTLLPILERI